MQELTQAQVRERLRAELSGFGARAEAARQTGLSKSTITRVLNGQQNAPDSLLALIGIERRAGYFVRNDG